MSDLIYIVILSLVVLYIDLHRTKGNFGAKFNGIGAIPDILAGESMAPMQYRVLVPWICGLFGEGNRDFAYLRPYMWIRWLSIPFALGMAHLYFGNIFHTTLLALFFIVAALYDYTDGYLEVGFFALAFWLMTAVPPPVSWYALMPLTFVATLNRETAMFIPATMVLTGNWIVGGVLFLIWIAAWTAPRQKYGRVARYCQFNQIPENLTLIWQQYKQRPFIYVEYTHFFILAGLLVYAAITTEWTPVFVSMGLMFGALLIPTKWNEIRVFGPIILALIPEVL